MLPNPFDHYPEAQPWMQVRAEYRSRCLRNERLMVAALIGGVMASVVAVAYSIAVMRGYVS